MLEIFDKAIEYARDYMTYSAFQARAEILKNAGDTSAWRLHWQAYKVMKIAEARCSENRLRDPQGSHETQMTTGELVEEIGCMKAKYGYGWQEGDGWLVKDYPKPSELIDTLSFIRKLGVKFERLDSNDIRDAVHLRVSLEDFDLIYNPVADFENKQQWGRG
jgi:hypothetical protein